MKITKQNYVLFISLCIFFVFYNIILFTIFGFRGLPGAFWASYIFMVLSIVLNVIARMLIFRNRLTARDWLFGFPALRYGFIYLTLQFIVSTIFMTVFSENGRLAVVISLVILAMYLFFVVSCFFSKEHIDKVETRVKEKVLFMRSIQADVQTIANKCTDAITQKFIKSLAQKMRLSDPMSHELLLDLEKNIAIEITRLKSIVEQGDFDVAKKQCNSIEQLLDERNRKCKILK